MGAQFTLCHHRVCFFCRGVTDSTAAPSGHQHLHMALQHCNGYQLRLSAHMQAAWADYMLPAHMFCKCHFTPLVLRWLR